MARLARLEQDYLMLNSPLLMVRFSGGPGSRCVGGLFMQSNLPFRQPETALD